jgi:hypothetical protein
MVRRPKIEGFTYHTNFCLETGHLKYHKTRCETITFVPSQRSGHMVGGTEKPRVGANESPHAKIQMLDPWLHVVYRDQRLGLDPNPTSTIICTIVNINTMFANGIARNKHGRNGIQTFPKACPYQRSRVRNLDRLQQIFHMTRMTNHGVPHGSPSLGHVAPFNLSEDTPLVNMRLVQIFFLGSNCTLPLVFPINICTYYMAAL